MIDKRAWESWTLWLLGMTVLLLPLTPSVAGIESWPHWIGWESAMVLFLLTLTWQVTVYVHPRLRLDTDVVLGCLLAVGVLVSHHVFLYSLADATPLFWQWIFLWLLLPALYAVISYYRKVAIVLIVLVLTMHAQWAVAQFAWQRDLGFSLLGESLIRADVSGVAKFWLVDQKVVRGYGPYAHANSMAGAQLIGLTLLSLLPMYARRAAVDFEARRILFWLFGGWMVLAILVSFSRSVYLGVAILAMFLTVRHRARIRKWARRYAGFGVLVLLLLSPLWWWRGTDPESAATEERVMGVSHALTIIADHPWRGVGMGHYPATLAQWAGSSGIRLEPWQVTYVHMVPLLLWSELGTIISGSLLVGFVYLVVRHGRYFILLVALLPCLLLDHYFYTYPSMVVLFFLLVSACCIMRGKFYE